MYCVFPKLGILMLRSDLSEVAIQTKNLNESAIDQKDKIDRLH